MPGHQIILTRFMDGYWRTPADKDGLIFEVRRIGTRRNAYYDVFELANPDCHGQRVFGGIAKLEAVRRELRIEIDDRMARERRASRAAAQAPRAPGAGAPDATAGSQR